MKKIHEDKYIVLTGGAGFIGSGMLRYLNDQGFTNVVIVDDLGTSEKWNNLVGKSFAEIVLIEDLFKWLEGREEDIQGFIHLGACSSTVEQDATYLLKNNYRYTIDLAEYALKHDHRFVYASSAATYGDGSAGFSDHHDQMEVLRPLNMYGYSKQLVDLWMKRQNVLDKVVGLKYFNVFGPNEAHKGRMASAVLRMVPQVQKTGKIELFKSSDPQSFDDGEQKRDFLYVKDAVSMTYELFKSDEGGIFNIGKGIADSWNGLATAVFKSLSVPASIKYIEMPADLIGKYQNYTCAEMQKFKKAFPKWRPTGLNDAVGDYVKNYLLKGVMW
jgi:ADP-L-glycero-D-manno-heptose 6-epimerase